MVETVYRNEQSELNQTEKGMSGFKMPKHVRQIGKNGSTKKIFIEDYVMTYIKQLSGTDYAKCKTAIFVGRQVKEEHCDQIFILGAMEAEEIDVTGGLRFTNEIWNNIYEGIKQYYGESEIVGWCIVGPGYQLENKEGIERVHIENFSGPDKVLMIYDSMEKEEAFYIYENNCLAKQEGFFIYYEKNDEMQNYMIERKAPVQSGTEAAYEDKVSREIRQVIQQKKANPPMNTTSESNRLMYGAGALMVVILLIVGAAILSNYERMQEMQRALDTLSNSIQNTGINQTKPSVTPGQEEADKDSENELNIDIIPGDVQPKEDEKVDKGSNEEDDPKENTPKQDQEKANKPEEGSDKKSDKKDDIKYYTVVSGDSLVGISYKLYSTGSYVSKIKELNDLEDENMIYIGQKLIVP